MDLARDTAEGQKAKPTHAIQDFLRDVKSDFLPKLCPCQRRQPQLRKMPQIAMAESTWQSYDWKGGVGTHLRLALDYS